MGGDEAVTALRRYIGELSGPPLVSGRLAAALTQTRISGLSTASS